MNSRKPMQLRLPQELKEWIKAESDRNGNSQNSEVIRAIRAAKDRRSSPGAFEKIAMDQGNNARC
ncbi:MULTISPECIES: Arc family DNA-binding protein [unclassified Ruegeria]|uniref:Arc family DNA-binding protein n=1 Tax=unclassified Ruegeria TaxID=2625375 RepID=UPI00148A1014|nr:MULTISPECIES: Arc family DNA-binding protein [unclassified Ruegeria]